jgi:hypothetical protein
MTESPVEVAHPTTSEPSVTPQSLAECSVSPHSQPERVEGSAQSVLEEVAASMVSCSRAARRYDAQVMIALCVVSTLQIYRLQFDSAADCQEQAGRLKAAKESWEKKSGWKRDKP